MPQPSNYLLLLNLVPITWAAVSHHLWRHSWLCYIVSFSLTCFRSVSSPYQIRSSTYALILTKTLLWCTMQGQGSGSVRWIRWDDGWVSHAYHSFGWQTRELKRWWHLLVCMSRSTVPAKGIFSDWLPQLMCIINPPLCTSLQLILIICAFTYKHEKTSNSKVALPVDIQTNKIRFKLHMRICSCIMLPHVQMGTNIHVYVLCPFFSQFWHTYSMILCGC